MKKIYIAIIFLTLLAVFTTCKKNEKVILPGVETSSVDEISITSARVGGRVSDNGSGEISDRGVYWGTTTNPETSGSKMQIGSGSGIFHETLSGLSSGVKYYVTAFATNSTGTYYGKETFFTTQISMPTVKTTPITEYTSTSARLGGSISDDGGFEVSQKGIYWGTQQNPRLTGAKVEMGSGNGDFSENFTGLSRAFTYYVIAYATNIKGTSYGEELSFTTQPEKPVVITADVIYVTTHAAKISGTISSNGGTEVTERGLYWGLSPNPVATGTKLQMGTGSGVFADTLKSLKPGTTYYATAYATNSIGTSYGSEKSFHTTGKIPEITKNFYTDLTSKTVLISGIVVPNELNTTISFEYGLTNAYGQNETSAIVLTTKEDTVNSEIKNLLPLTVYHYRVKAENELGVAYSRDSTFRTYMTGEKSTVYDHDNNLYNTIGIGYQEWMIGNLRDTSYNDGSGMIPNIRKDSLWATLTSPAFCWYLNKKTTYGDTYGALYNWYAVETGKLCPSGWHVARDSDYLQLIQFAGGALYAGGRLKETGTDHWNPPNKDATDAFSFKGLAGGKRSADGVFDFVMVEGNWWTKDAYSTLNAFYFNLLYNYGNSFQAYSSKKTGMSVRCVKD